MFHLDLGAAMYLRITGFLTDDSEDDSLKLELDIEPEHERSVVNALGHESIDAMASGEWLLTKEQVQKLSDLIKRPLPIDLEIFIGVAA